MSSVSVIQKKHRKKNDGTFPICIRITEGAKTRYKYIGYSVKQEQFKEGLSDWVKKHPDALYINSIIEDERSKIQEKITRLRLDGKSFDFDFILSDSPAAGHTLFEILDIIANSHLENQDLAAGYRHTSLKNQIKDCLGGDIVLNDLKIDHVKRIIQHFTTKEGNNRNTVSRKLRYLRGAFREAKLKWSPDISGENPFEMLRIKSEPINRVKLNPEQIKAIEDLPLVGFIDVARDAFLFSFYAQGMRFGSVITLTKDQITKEGIKYRMSKGLHFRTIEIHPKLQRIINKYYDTDSQYLFPILKSKPKDKAQLKHATDSANTMVNTSLKRIAILIGLQEELSFHITKHSYAQMLKRNGVDPWIIKDSLGHVKFSTTDMYLNSLDDEQINKAVTGLY